MTTLLTLLTDQQNRLIDQRAETYKYNKEIQNVHMTHLCSSFDRQSSFYLGKTSWMIGGRVVQVFLLGISSYSDHMTEIFQECIKGLPPSNAMFEVFNQLFTPYYESESPHFESDKVVAQKKLEVLTQSDTAEMNKSDQLQQIIQNAKDVFAQLLKTLFN